MMLAALLFIVSALGAGAAGSPGVFIIARIGGGSTAESWGGYQAWR